MAAAPIDAAATRAADLRGAAAGHALQHRLAPRSRLSRSGALEQHRCRLSHRGRPGLLQPCSRAPSADARRNAPASARDAAARVPRHSPRRVRQRSAARRRTATLATAARERVAAARDAGGPTAAAPLRARLQWVWPTERSARRARAGRRHLAAGSIGPGRARGVRGRVVYTGSGIRGYGNLIIIKHGENLLSAYAHNRELAGARRPGGRRRASDRAHGDGPASDRRCCTSKFG